MIPIKWSIIHQGSENGWNFQVDLGVNCDGIVQFPGSYFWLFSREEQKIRLKAYYWEAGTGNGVCMICGELDPRLFITHHVFGRKNDNFEVTLCANCHRRYSVPSDLHYILIMRAIERAI